MENGSYIAHEADRFGVMTEKWTDAQHALYGKSELAKLQALWGDKTQERIELGKTFIKNLDKKSPGVIRLLNDTGLGNNAKIISVIVGHAERLAYRNGKR